MKIIPNPHAHNSIEYKRRLRIMKLITILCIVSLLPISASTYSQGSLFNLNLTNTSIIDIFNQIEQESGYHFFYNEQYVDLEKKVDINVTEMEITKILDLVLENTSSTYTIIDDDLIVILPKNTIQQLRVTGIVTDGESGEPLPGVNVIIEGTTKGVISDLNGRYTIEVPAPDAILTFSFMGYISKSIPVNSQTAIDIALVPEIKTISELVVVGYGTARKSDVTGAISTIDQKKLLEVPSVDVSQALQGRIPGVTVEQTSTRPGAQSQIRIRGTRSLNASNDPLMIVDGIPFDGNLSDINPFDIKSIDVLKDASATAIYGSRGANGVILITTNRGAISKLTITYDGYYGTGKVAKKYPVFSAEEFVKYRDISGFESGSPYLPQEQHYFTDGESYDWQDEIYKTAIITQHNLTISGGSEKTQSSIGGGYYNETSVMPGQEYTRYSFRGTIDHKINKWLNIGLNTQIAYGITDGEDTDVKDVNGVNAGNLWAICAFSPLVNPYDSLGNVITQPLYPREDGYSPLLINDKSLWEKRRKRFNNINSLYAEVQLLPSLKYRANLGAYYSNEDFGEYYSSESSMKSGAKSSAAIGNRNAYSYTLENLLYYNKDFNTNHNIGITLLYSVQDSYDKESKIDASDMLVDYVQYYNLALSSDPVAVQEDKQINNRRTILSYMARVNYAFKNRYIITLTGRRDGSSVLSEGNKWHNYPAISTAWNIRNEPFMKDISWMDMLKIRLGYGQTSNQAIEPYSTLGKLSQNKYNFGDNFVNGFYNSSLPNTNLGWEYTYSYNAGIDYSFFSGRLAGSIDMYIQKTNDLLLEKSLPVTSGVPGEVYVNAGKTENKGIEISVYADIIRSEDPGGFNWSTDLVYYRNKNKIISLTSGVEKDEGNGWFVGYPIDVIYDYNKIGIWQLNEADTAIYGTHPGDFKIEDVAGGFDADGNPMPDSIIDALDRYVQGPLYPDFELGITNRFSYKNFDLTVVAYAKVGGLLVSTVHQQQSYLNILDGRRNNLKVDYWTPENPTNDHPKPRVGGVSHQFAPTLGYFDATYLKIRTITIGYTFKDKVLSKIKVDGLRVYFTCKNVATLFSPYMKAGGIDPEPTGYGRQGINHVGRPPKDRQLSVGLNTPPSRQFIFGLIVKI